MRITFKISFFIAVISFPLIFNSVLYSQNIRNGLKGKVVNVETNEPIQYATIFLAYTSIGTLTDENGEYSLSGITDGNYEIVCAAVGYEKVNKHLLIVGSKIFDTKFHLKQVPIQIGEVNITASIPEDWEDNLLKFTKEFLGESTIARQCIISNPEVIDFEIKENRLFASSKKPLYVINKALGYKLTVFIKHFEWDVDYDEGKYAYDPFFESLISEDSAQQIRWEENRKIAYLGSFNHFLRSNASNTGFDDGFRLMLNSSEDQLKKNNYNIRAKNQIFRKNWQTKDEYYGVLLAFMKNTANNNFVFETEDQIFVIFGNEGEDTNFKWYKSRVFGNGEKKEYQSSSLNLPMGRLTFNKEGNILDKTMFNTSLSGYWAWKRVGDLLPNDYVLTNNMK